MSPMMIPRHILNPILDDIIEYAKEKSKTHPKIQNYVTCFEDIKSKKTFEEPFPAFPFYLLLWSLPRNSL